MYFAPSYYVPGIVLQLLAEKADKVPAFMKLWDE